MYIHNYISTIIYHLVAITVMFNESSYCVDEDGGSVQPVLVLSNSSLTDITIEVGEANDTATSEYTKIL